MPALPLHFYADHRRTALREQRLREESALPPERLLQAIWRHQRLRADALRTADGCRLRVLHPGFPNAESGPDFRGALLQFADGATEQGDVEIDVAAGGWRAHGHEKNPAFENVILHVVWEGAGRSAHPTLALKPALDAPLAELSESLGGEVSPEFRGLAGMCSAPLLGLAPELRDELLRQAALVRLNQKGRHLLARARETGWERALWENLFGALGYKHNAWPMRRVGELAAAWPEISLTVEELQARLLGVGGWLPAELPRGRNADARYARTLWDAWWRERERFAEVTLPRRAWRMSGVRPANHPQRRLATAAHWLAAGDLPGRVEAWFTANISDDELAESLAAILQPTGDVFWSWHWTLASPRLARPQSLLGANRITDLAVNVILPWLWMRASAGDNAALRQRAEARYLAWPAGEDNSVLRLARQRLFGTSSARGVRTAAAQQGVLQVVRDFCDHSNAICDGCRFPELIADAARAWSTGTR